MLIHYDADLYSSTLFLLATIWPQLKEYYFIMDDFGQDDMVALHDFTMAFPVKIEWLAQRQGVPDWPAQTFGMMTRIIASDIIDSGRTFRSELPSAKTVPICGGKEITVKRIWC